MNSCQMSISDEFIDAFGEMLLRPETRPYPLHDTYIVDLSKLPHKLKQGEETMNLNDLKRKHEELGKEIERLEQQSGRWMPENGDSYFFISSGGCVSGEIWNDDAVDCRRLLYNNVFKTKDQTIRYTIIDRKIREIAARNPVDWSDRRQPKFIIWYKLEPDELYIVTHFSGITPFSVYSSDLNFLDICKKEIGENELKWFFRFQAWLES